MRLLQALAAWLVTRGPWLRHFTAGTNLRERSAMPTKILEAIAAAAAPIIAERLAQELRDALPEIAEHLVDAVIGKLPDMAHLDEALIAVLNTALSEVTKNLPFPFNLRP
ncbi:hypothetical protein I5H06_gp06 [Mycobacterium phage SirPhilip]|uniref:Uncharacterized protein n=1 Tax=Mycobacterium phage SirPhilip TaxID=2015824 RepID=A0A222ZLF8_9CAUD|nr:hypothetical protein I5H06_gp06 [Mycobacterium phage SirPhilip]ASR85298.1 hypothetical protein SEA_SIRPHILIP_96 [Mycobacterium phage SirPhilip]